MAAHDAERRDADDPRGLNIFLIFFDHRRAAHRARVLDPIRRADRKNQHCQRDSVVGAARQHDPCDAVDQERNQNRGKGKLHIGDPHDHRVGASADVAGEQPERYADDDRQRDRCRAHEKRDARAVHDRGQHVAALVIGAEEIAGFTSLFPRGRRQRVVQAQRRQVEWIVRRDPRCEERADQAYRQHDRRDDGYRRMAKAVGKIAVPSNGERVAHADRVLERGRRRRGGRVVHARRSAMPCSACSTAGRACP